MDEKQLIDLDKIFGNLLNGEMPDLALLESVISALQEKKQEILRKDEEERLRQQEWEQRVHEITDLDFSAGFANPYAIDQDSSNIRVDSPEDGLVISLANLGKVDIAYIAKISGQTPKKVVSCLKGSIFQNPDTWNESVLDGWETSDEYLSGCIAKKLISARAANEKYFGYFSDNIVALEKAMPRMSLASEIYISLGSPWIPPKTIEAFLKHLFPDAYFSMEVEHDEAFSSWKIPHRSWAHGASFEKTWGTKKRNALYLVESALNMKTPEIRYDELDCIYHPGAKKGDVWVQATMEAVEKQRLLIKEFRRWVWEDKARREELQAIYHERFGSIRTRKYDGSFLPFKGLSPEVSLYPYQKDAVARIIFSKNALLAHDVGAGKTYVMIAAAMEMKRIGISPKNMFVVPNNVLKQWESVFKTMYPYANPLVIGPSNFTKEKRGDAMKEMKDGAYDAIIIAYSCFNQIPLSEKTLMGTIEDEISKLTDFLDQGSFASNVDRRRKALYKARQALFEAADETGIHFDDLGITRLFIDEAHNYKNLPFTTKMGNVLGLNPEGSKLCQAMYEKVRSVQKEGGVIFATGTPITNSIADIYTMQRYLQPGQLELMGLSEFDAWVGSFASVKRGFEVDVDTNSFRMASRLSEFHNLPELSSMIALLADFHAVDNQECLPAFGGHDDVVVPQSQSLSKYLSEISRRAEAVRCHLVSRAQDNMLKITTDGRKAALDIRLVDPTLNPGASCKLIICADKVAAIYHEHFFQHAAQLIFCDYSVPSSSWNVYDEMKRLLMDRGVFESDIAFVHDATTETKRDLLFRKVRRGETRILLGSTFKLGIGVNVQDNLIALHHLDVPWRPSDMVQREGRILRQGNQNESVHIYRYVTQGSFDAYSWQLLETKQRFISALLSGQMGQRDGQDMSNEALSYAEVKALAVGNPIIKERIEVANELARYLFLQRSLTQSRQDAAEEYIALRHRIASTNEQILLCEEDAVFAETLEKTSKEIRAEMRQRLQKALIKADMSPKETSIGTYSGFEVVLPAGMLPDKPFCFLQRKGSYEVKLGQEEAGNLVRIDNFIARFDDYLAELRRKVIELENLAAQAKKTSEEVGDYSGNIDQCRKKLADIDKKLGVIK